MRRGFFPSLERKDARTFRRVAASAGWLAKRMPYQTTWDVERAIRDGFERVLMVYRCIDAIATNQARTPVVVRQGSRDGEEVDATGVDLVRLLNKRPNTYETAQQFRYRLSCQLLLSKQGVFVELVRSRGGGLAELHLLPPGRTAPIPDEDRFLSGFRVTYPDGGWDDLAPERVLWIRKPHPTNPYLGTTPLEAAGLTADVDFYARLFNRNFLLNDGRPGGLVAVKGELSKEDAEELKRRFAGGPSGAGRTTVIEADDVNWVDTATTPRDAQYTESMSGTKLDLMLAFGVPESVLGNASARTYDNAGAEEAIFWRVTMIPHCELIDGSFDTLTVGGVEDDLFLVHDTSGIAPLQRDTREREAKYLQEFQAGAISLDEYRVYTRRRPLDVPGSKVVWLPQGKIPVGQDQDQQDVAELIALIQSGAPAGGGLPMTSDPGQFDATAMQGPSTDYVRGGWQADGAADQLDRTANGAGNNTGNGTADPRGNGLARGLYKGLRFPLPADVDTKTLAELVTLLADQAA